MHELDVDCLHPDEWGLAAPRAGRMSHSPSASRTPHGHGFSEVDPPLSAAQAEERYQPGIRKIPDRRRQDMSESKQSSISRRDFSKRAALGAAAITAFTLPREAQAQDTIKIALVGAGGRGTGAVQNAIQAGQHSGAKVELIALGDVIEETAKGAVRGFKENANLKDSIKVDDSTTFWGLDAYQKVIAMKPDYMILATPPGFRPEMFEAVVNAKLNCFCEKPVATDFNGIRRYMAAAKKSEELKLHIVTGNQRRHQKNYVETVEKLHDGALGDIVAMRVYWDGGLPHARERKPGMSDLRYQLYNWYNFCWICGDNIVEQHIHNLDVANWVLNSHPVSVIASGGRSWKPEIEKYGNIWDNFSCDYEYPNGVHVFSYCRHLNHSYDEVSERAFGTNKNFHGGVSNCADMGEGGLNPYVQEHVDLQNAMMGKGPYWNQAVQVCESTMTAIMGREAAYTGKRLVWDEAINSDLDIFPKNMSWDADMPPAPIPRTPMP
ncbi:MAG: gfo/Idh/MocA family oxidoreductase [bacterium]|nr:gfo/Idh/MocA family oxidoreductase [bacterium]